MTGTNAYAVLDDRGTRRARVWILVLASRYRKWIRPGLPDNLPVLRRFFPSSVNLKPVWKHQTPQDGFRVGVLSFHEQSLPLTRPRSAPGISFLLL
jgi:hypothetical protein